MYVIHKRSAAVIVVAIDTVYFILQKAIGMSMQYCKVCLSSPFLQSPMARSLANDKID